MSISGDYLLSHDVEVLMVASRGLCAKARQTYTFHSEVIND